MAKNKVAREVAEVEFQRFCDCMDLDLDPKGMDQDDLKGFEQNKTRVLNAIMSGSLTVDAEGILTFSPQKSDGVTIVFKEPKGSALLAMDGKKKGAEMSKTFALLAEMTGQNQNTFTQMFMRDLKVCQAIFTLFLG